MNAQTDAPATGYPLQWPPGWKRTTWRRSAPYKVTIDRAYDDLQNTLKLLGALKGSVIVSSNVPPRNAFGTPRNDGATIGDPGVAVYWSTTAHGARVVACDKWNSVRDNVRAIGLALDGLRAMERAGATQIMDRAYEAFGALPAAPAAPVARPWWEVLAFPQALIAHLTVAVVEARYRELATKAHPDRGGSNEAMAELNRAREQALAHFQRTA
jgi:hypothetical protein